MWFAYDFLLDVNIGSAVTTGFAIKTSFAIILLQNSLR
jgi:hypothetical protein